MVTRSRKTQIEKELDRLEKSGEEFTLADVAYKLNSTSCVLAFAIRLRGTAQCLTPRTGRSGLGRHSRYKFIKATE